MEGIEGRELTLALGGDSKLKRDGVRIFGEIRACRICDARRQGGVLGGW